MRDIRLANEEYLHDITRNLTTQNSIVEGRTPNSIQFFYVSTV